MSAPAQPVVERDLQLQVTRCTVCCEIKEIPRRLLRDPHGLLEWTRDVADDHRECAANRDNLRLAINARMFRKRTERELRRCSQRDRHDHATTQR